MPAAALLIAALLALSLPRAGFADEPGWKRAITAGEAAYRSGDLAEAGFAFGTALKNAESFGESDTRVATSLGWLAETYRLQGRLAEAEPLLKRALAIRERVLGPMHPSTHLTRHNLGVLRKAMSDTGAVPAPPQSPSARQAELAPLKEAARPVEVIAAKPAPLPVVETPKPTPPVVIEKPKPEPAAPLVVVERPKPAAVVIAEAPKPRPEPATPPVVVEKPKPEPAAPPVAMERPKPAPAVIAEAPKPEPESVAPPVAPQAPKPAPILELAKPKPASAAPPVVAAEPKPAPRLVETPKPAPEPESKPLAALFSLFTPKPSPPPKPEAVAAAPVAVEPPPRPKPQPAPVAAIAPKPPPPAPAPLPFSPRQAQRADIAAQLGALASGPAQVRQAFELLQRARTHGGATTPLAAVQALLGPGEAMLCYFIAERASHLIALRRDRAELFTLDMGREQIAASVKRLRVQLDPARDQGIAGRFPEFAFDVSLRLYRSLVAPARALLEDAAHLFVVPDEALQGLPFAVLTTEPVGEQAAKAPEQLRPGWLAHRHVISVLPDEQALATVRRGPSAARKNFAGFADPQFAESRYLLEAMADILQSGDGDLYTGAEARDAAVRRMDLSGFRVLAFANQARMTGERAEGLLTPDEIANLRLDADLVMLTAGGTAGADGTPGAEGLPRLARAFIDAGSRSLVVPHWTVRTDSTLKLVSRMLRERARGAGNAEALRRAMLALMNGEDRIAYTHPMYWAALQVVGN